MITRVRRHAARFGAIAAVLSSAILMVNPTSASAGTCGVRGCGQYQIYMTDTSGSVAHIAYADKQEWMVYVNRNFYNGWHQSYPWVTERILDTATGFEDKIVFNTGASHGFNFYNTGSSGESGWLEFNHPCPVIVPAVSETVAWEGFFLDIQDVYRGTAANYVYIADAAGDYLGSC